MKLSPSLLRVGMKLSDPDLLQTAEPFYILYLLLWGVSAGTALAQTVGYSNSRHLPRGVS
jgi:hypothetical protein